MRSAWWQLFVKEIRQAAGPALVFSLLIVLWLGFLYTRVGKWPNLVPFVLGMSSLAFLPFWALWRSFYGLRQEWTGNHMYLLLALPVPGWYITSTKLLVAVVELFWYAGLILVGTGSMFLLFSDGAANVQLELLRETSVLGTAVRAAALQAIALLIGMIIIQFAYLFGRLVNRRRGLMTLATGAVSGWFVFRVGGLLAPLLQWFPDMTVQSLIIENNDIYTTTTYIGVAPVIGSLLAAVLLFVLGSVILERDIEL